MLKKSTKRGRKSIPADQKTSVFGIAVLANLLKKYKRLPDNEQKIVRQETRKSFENATSRIVGAKMVASDDREYFS